MNNEQYEKLVKKVDGILRVQMLTGVGNILMATMVTAIFLLIVWNMIECLIKHFNIRREIY